MIICRNVLNKIVCNIFLSCSTYNEDCFKGFWSLIQKYHIFIARDFFCLVVTLEIPAAEVFSVHTCVMGCGWPISYNMFS